MSVAREFEAANANYVSTFDKGALPLPPARYGPDFDILQVQALSSNLAIANRLPRCVARLQ